MTLTLDIPTDTPQSADEEREKVLRAAIVLFDARFITQGQAAEIAGLSRTEFYDALGRFGVTPFQYTWEEAWEDADLLETRRRRHGQAARPYGGAAPS